jgi:hypothetical protein
MRLSGQDSKLLGVFIEASKIFVQYEIFFSIFSTRQHKNMKNFGVCRKHVKILWTFKKIFVWWVYDVERDNNSLRKQYSGTEYT